MKILNIVVICLTGSIFLFISYIQMYFNLIRFAFSVL